MSGTELSDLTSEDEMDPDPNGVSHIRSNRYPAIYRACRGVHPIDFGRRNGDYNGSPSNGKGNYEGEPFDHH